MTPNEALDLILSRIGAPVAWIEIGEGDTERWLVAEQLVEAGHIQRRAIVNNVRAYYIDQDSDLGVLADAWWARASQREAAFYATPS